MRVLIADDDPLIRRLIECMLRNAGHEVVLAADGSEALRILQAENAPKLAIVDWMMPGLDGVELCRRLRQTLTSEPPYVILVTGRDLQEDVLAGLRSGASDYVTKPVKREQLLARIEIGARVVELQATLSARSRELEAALAEKGRRLQLSADPIGLVPMVKEIG